MYLEAKYSVGHVPGRSLQFSVFLPAWFILIGMPIK